jgi:hypothetical protein
VAIVKSRNISAGTQSRKFLSRPLRRYLRELEERPLAVPNATKLDIRRLPDDCLLRPIRERDMLRNLSDLFTLAVDQHHVAEKPASCHGGRCIDK